MLSPSHADALVLPEASLAALHDAQQALLSPFSPSTSLAQSVEAGQAALQRLFGTPHAALLLSHPPPLRGHATAFDACVQTIPPEALPTGYETVLTWEDLTAGATAHFRASGYGCVIGAFSRTPSQWAGVYVAFTDADAPLLSAAGTRLLRLLIPALRSFAHHRAEASPPSFEFFEKLGEPLAIYDAAGREVCCSRAFQRLLRGDDEAARVRSEASELAVAVHVPPESPGAARATSLVRTVRTARNRYELHASPMPRVVVDMHASLIHLRGYRVRMPSPTRLRTRLGLTQREAEVALLVAEGLTSKEIAARLDLSAHTVRRHGERVLEKLGLHTRAGVGLALMRLG